MSLYHVIKKKAFIGKRVLSKNLKIWICPSVVYNLKDTPTFDKELKSPEVYFSSYLLMKKYFK